MAEATRAAWAKPMARRDLSVITTFRWPPSRSSSVMGMQVKPRAVQELAEEHVARLRPSRLVQPAGKHAEGVLVDQAEPLVQHHEDAVDVDVAERKGNLEEVLHVLAEHELAQGPRALLVGAIAQRRHRGVVADEGDAPAFQEARRLDGAQYGHAQAGERPAHHRLVAPAALEMRPHEDGPPAEDGGEVAGVGHVGTVVDVAARRRRRRPAPRAGAGSRPRGSGTREASRRSRRRTAWRRRDARS